MVVWIRLYVWSRGDAMKRSIVRVVAAVSLPFLGAGCFKYIPTELDAVPPGENVRVYVTRNVVTSIEEVIRTNDPVLNGQIVRRQDDNLFLRVPTAVRREGFHSVPIGQDLAIPLRDIIQVERRQIDRIGTGALVAGTLGAAATVIFVIMEAYGDPEFVEECEDCVDLMTPLRLLPGR
jgi:hypothetical protein